jgi:hypothetical protein
VDTLSPAPGADLLAAAQRTVVGDADLVDALALHVNSAQWFKKADFFGGIR